VDHKYRSTSWNRPSASGTVDSQALSVTQTPRWRGKGIRTELCRRTGLVQLPQYATTATRRSCANAATMMATGATTLEPESFRHCGNRDTLQKTVHISWITTRERQPGSTQDANSISHVWWAKRQQHHPAATCFATWSIAQWMGNATHDTARVYFVDHNTKTTTWDDPRLPSSLDQNVPQYKRDFRRNSSTSALKRLSESFWQWPCQGSKIPYFRRLLCRDHAQSVRI